MAHLGYNYDPAHQAGVGPRYNYVPPPQAGVDPRYNYVPPPQAGVGPTYNYVPPPQAGVDPRYNYVPPHQTGGAASYGYAAPAEGSQQAFGYYSDPNTPPMGGKPLYHPNEIESEPNLKRFVNQGYKDIWAALIFLTLFVGSIVWGIVNFITYTPISPEKESDDSHRRKLNLTWAARVTVFVTICGAIWILIAFFLIYLMKCSPKIYIYLSYLLNCALLAFAAVFAGLNRSWAACAVMAVLCLLQLIALYCIRHRIAFAAALLATSANVVLKYKAIFLVSILTVVLMIVYVFVGFFMAFPSIDRSYHKRKRKGDIAIICVFVFIYLYATQVFVNVLHVTSSGLVATWYFAGFPNMPSNPTLASLGRALTTSFGSICFGSLLVAIIEFIRFLVKSMDSEDSFLRCILDCCLACIESLVEYFNTYAFVHVAIYGCGYIEGAKRTFRLFQQSLFKAIFNDCLVSPTLLMSSFFLSLALGVISGLIDWSVPTGLVSFIVSFFVSSILLSPIHSAVVTIFVCFAEAPEALERSDPSLYQTIRDADAEYT